MPPTRVQTSSRPVHTELHRILERGKFSDTTRRKYRNVIDQFLKVAGSDPKGWTRTAMDRFRGGLITRGMKPESIETYLASLHYVSKWWAADHNGIDFAVIQPIDLPGVPATPRRALTEAEAEKLLVSCVEGNPNLFGLRDLVLVVIDLETGMRITGLSEMAFDRIGTSTFGYPIATVPIKSRGGKVKYPVPLSDLVMLAIERWQNALGDPKSGSVFRRLLKHERADGETTIRHSAQGLSTTSLYKIIVKRALKAGIGHVHPHILRHTFITWRIEAQVPPIQIAAITGHKVSTITEDDYGEIETYINKDKLGMTARKHTPTWLSQLVRKLLKEF